MPGDVVTLSFDTDVQPLITPVATIGGHTATVTEGAPVSLGDGLGTEYPWTASVTMQSGDTEGIIVFTLDAGSVDGTATTTVPDVANPGTTDGSSVTFKNASPVLAETTPVPTPTNNTAPSYSFTSSEAGTLTMSGTGCSTSATTTGVGVNAIIFNTLAGGTYACSITVTDTNGNASAPLSMSKFVIDTTPPVITLNGNASMSLTVGDTFTDPGATAADTVDGTDPVTTSGSVGTSTAGTYTLTYNAVDAAGNTAKPVTRSVTVNAPPAPAPPSSGGESSNGPIVGSFGEHAIVPTPPAPSPPPAPNPVSAVPADESGSSNENSPAPTPTKTVNVPSFHASTPAPVVATVAPRTPNEPPVVASPTSSQVAGVAAVVETPANASVESGLGEFLQEFWWWLLILLILGAGYWVWKKYRREHYETGD